MSSAAVLSLDVQAEVFRNRQTQMDIAVTYDKGWLEVSDSMKGFDPPPF